MNLETDVMQALLRAKVLEALLHEPLAFEIECLGQKLVPEVRVVEDGAIATVEVPLNGNHLEWVDVSLLKDGVALLIQSVHIGRTPIRGDSLNLEWAVTLSTMTRSAA